MRKARQASPRPTAAQERSSTSRRGGWSWPERFGSGASGPRFNFGEIRILAPSADERTTPVAPSTAERSQSLLDQAVADPGDPLPHRRTLERAFAPFDLSNLVAHRGPRASAAADAFSAAAVTLGRHIVLGRDTSLETVAHETTHALLQQHGVGPLDGAGRPGDRFEHFADGISRDVVEGREVGVDVRSGLKDRRHSPIVAIQARTLPAPPVKTRFGTFETRKYEMLGPDGDELGVEIELAFSPNDYVDAMKIALVQTARSRESGAAIALYPSQRGRMLVGGADEGTQVDQRVSVGPYSNPAYAAGPTRPGDRLSDALTDTRGQLGWRFLNEEGEAHVQTATLHDRPAINTSAPDSGQEFETAALVIEGRDDGTYLGSVRWGWNRDVSGRFSPVLPELAGAASPSSTFVAAARRWNQWRTRGSVKTIAPCPVLGPGFRPVFVLLEEADVSVYADVVVYGGRVYNQVRIRTGPYSDKSGFVLGSNLRDVGDGAPTIPLPIPGP